MSDPNERRRHAVTPDDITKAVKAALDAKSSLRKGEDDAWGEWLSRAFRDPRVFIPILVAAVSVGGRYERVTAGIAALQGQTTELAAAQRAFRQDLAELHGLLDKHERLLAVEQSHATRADLEGLKDQIARITTRPEMTAALRQQLIPRIDRIDARLALLERQVGGR